MNFGCFGFARHIPWIEEAGFDSAELDICEIADMSGGEFSRLCSLAETSRLTFPVFSGLIPLTVRFHSDDFDRDYWLAHVRRSAERVSRLGCRIIPFGAGKCRSIPENCPDPEQAKAAVRSLVTDICRILEEYGIMLVIEPLGPANSNYINYIKEAVEFVRQICLPNCQTMCDLRHMHKLGESMTEIAAFRSYIRHAHIDYPEGGRRLFPQETDGFDYAPYFKALFDAGYDGLLTIEATDYADFPGEAKSSLELLKRYAAGQFR